MTSRKKNKTVTTVTTTTTTTTAVGDIKPTHIIAVLDRSGSMSSRATDVIGGFNAFLKNQKEIKDGSYMSLYLFDDHINRVFHNKGLEEVGELNSSTYTIGGSTALLDAVGTAINDAGDEKKAVLFVITDGQENASTRFRKEAIQGLISEREKKGWQVIYLGADVNAFADAAAAGFGVSNTANFVNTRSGYWTANATADLATKSYRMGSARGMSSFSGGDYASVASLYNSFAPDIQLDASLINTIPPTTSSDTSDKKEDDKSKAA